MRPDRLATLSFAALALAGLVLAGPACQREAEPGTSSKARVMPKNGEVWGRDLATGLGLHARRLFTA